MKFIGRKKELQALDDLYRKSAFRMCIIYGRRRIGKSTLIAEFLKGKEGIFYTATKVGAKRNLDLLATQVTACLEPTLKNISFDTLEDLFDFITIKVSDRNIVLVIDELPYWADKDEGLLTILQKYIDTAWANKNIFLILCGSSLSFMEGHVLSEKSPLFGRRDSQIKLDSFDYLEAAEFVPDYTPEDKAICYGITGGVAKYLSLIDPCQSLDANIINLFFKNNGYLYDETRNLLVQEFSDITLVNNIIEQIADGQNTLSSISAKLHESEPAITYILKKLISVGLVEKKFCITEEKNKKKIQYILKDHMFKFWYTYIPKAISVIELGYGDTYYEKIVKPDLHNYMGKVFEDMCRYYTLKEGITGKFGCFITQTGNWWGMENIIDTNGQKRAQPADIDVVGLSPADHSMVIGECKFRNEKIDKEIFEALLRRGNAIPANYKIEKFIFFSLSGYTEWVLHESQNRNCLFLTLNDLY